MLVLQGMTATAFPATAKASTYNLVINSMRLCVPLTSAGQ
jgi:hypothetical protein